MNEKLQILMYAIGIFSAGWGCGFLSTKWERQQDEKNYFQWKESVRKGAKR